MKFLIIKKKTVCIVMAIIMAIASMITFSIITTSSSPKAEYTIVIDAGHGGRDGGTSGKASGISESELNLAYAKTLKQMCEQFGIAVVMTREDMNGLYDENASNKKKSEMEKRKQIINNSGADIMVSIHMNAFPLPSCSGAQVFYAKGSQEGENLARSITLSICQSFDNARDYPTVGDYFVLNYSNMPSVLIECGFLSNIEEEANLQKEEYRQSFCYAIMAGILSYFRF